MSNLKRNAKFCVQRPHKKVKIMDEIEENKNHKNYDNNFDFDESLQQQRKNNSNKKVAKLFRNDKDQKQFEEIVVSIEESALDDVLPKDIITEMASFATGKWLPCCECGETVSFLAKNGEGRIAVECVGCNAIIWEHVCEEDGESFTAFSAIGSKCSDCNRRVCDECYESCVCCGDKSCIMCSHACDTCSSIICNDCDERTWIACSKCCKTKPFKFFKPLHEIMRWSHED